MRETDEATLADLLDEWADRHPEEMRSLEGDRYGVVKDWGVEKFGLSTTGPHVLRGVVIQAVLDALDRRGIVRSEIRDHMPEEGDTASRFVNGYLNMIQNHA